MWCLQPSDGGKVAIIGAETRSYKMSGEYERKENARMLAAASKVVHVVSFSTDFVSEEIDGHVDSTEAKPKGEPNLLIDELYSLSQLN